MKKITFIIVLILISLCVYSKDIPLSIIYPGELIDNATVEDQKLVIDTLITYLNKSNNMESIVYSPEMPSVLLLVKEEKLTPDEIGLNVSVDEKIKVGKTLDYDYLFLPEIGRNKQTFEINLNVYDLKKNQLKPYGAVLRADSKKFTSDVNSAVSGITFQILKDILGENPSFEVGKENNNQENVSEEIDYSTLDLKELIKIGDKELKAGNILQAINIYTKSIDKSPDDPELRLKLASAYYAKQMYKEALDQYYNAINMGYRGEDIYKLKQMYEARVRAEDYVKPVEEIKNEISNSQNDVVLAPPKLTNPAGEFNKQIEDALTKSDEIWKKGNFSEALKSYTEIVQKYPFDYRAYERISLVYANNKRFSDCAKVLKVLEGRKIDYSRKVITDRVNTLSAVISAFYVQTCGQLRKSKDFIVANPGNQRAFNDLKVQSNKIYETMELINVLGGQSNSFHVTNLKLTGNLINSAISSFMDYLDDMDVDAINSAENFINQAEIRTKQIKY